MPSNENCLADQAFRTLRTETEWALNTNIFNKITYLLGIPEIDLFASIDNCKCKRYISWVLDPAAESIDAFTVHWGNPNFFAFPSFPLILRTIQKIINDKASGLLVVP